MRKNCFREFRMRKAMAVVLLVLECPKSYLRFGKKKKKTILACAMLHRTTPRNQTPFNRIRING